VTALFLWGAAGEGVGRWGWLGVRIRDLSEQEMNEISARHGIREGFGAVIVEVIKETPAEASGLAPGDVVVAVRDQPVPDTRTLQRLIAATGVGQPVALTVLRREEGRRRLSVTLAAMPDAVVAERVAAEMGFLLRDPDRQGEGRGEPGPGVAGVGGVLPRSRAAAAGLRVGDVLVEIDGRPVSSLEAAREVLVEVALDRAVRLVVARDGQRVRILVPAPPGP
jgi:serine protease Do